MLELFYVYGCTNKNTSQIYSFPEILLGYFWEVFGKAGVHMRKKNYKGRCEKRSVSKCQTVCRIYDLIQSRYLDMLQENDDVIEIRCNVLLDGNEAGEYMTDFVCVKKSSDLMVRECVQRKYLTKPMTVKALDLSREYWLKHGVSDWGLVIDEE